VLRRVACRRVGNADSDAITTFEDAYRRVDRWIEERCGIFVSISDVRDPNAHARRNADWKPSRTSAARERLFIASLIEPGAGELLTPLAIPEFTPTRRTSRWAF
jgi:hypothetical protein